MEILRRGFYKDSSIWQEKKTSAFVCKPPSGLQDCGPPVVEAPKGVDVPREVPMADAFEPPPGLECIAGMGNTSTRKFHASPAAGKVLRIPVAKVRIRGFPKSLLVDSMIEAILHQANLDGTVVDTVVTHGSPCGEVILSFAHPSAVMQCLQHFERCEWSTVHCEVIPKFDDVGKDLAPSMEPARISVTPWLLSAKTPLFDLAADLEPPVCAAKSLSAAAAVFHPQAKVSSAASAVFGPEASGLCIAAAVFIPGAERHDGNMKAAVLPTLAPSDISTDEELGMWVSED